MPMTVSRSHFSWPRSVVHTACRCDLVALRRGRRVRAPPARAAGGGARVPGPDGAFDESSRGEARRKLFNNIAPQYDALNDLLSLGLHRVWKRCAVMWCAAPEGGRVLDVCTGTGDLAFLLAQSVGRDGEVVAVDFAADILREAQRRYDSLPRSDRYRTRITFKEGDALRLPFEGNSFDGATIGYGLRNVGDPLVALQELWRVLKPGTRAVVLDFNNPRDAPVVDQFQSVMLSRVVVPVASMMGLGEEYEYLRPSIERFPTGREQERLAKEAGFTSARHYELAGGLMGCLVAEK